MGLVGLGKISRDQHIPTIAASSNFTLVAGVSPHDRLDGLACYATLNEMFSNETVDALAINTPPFVRFDLAREALLAGKHVLLEKPPCTTLSQMAELEGIARERGLTLYTAWHSQHAPAIPHLRRWLEEKAVRRLDVTWREDVDQWHPGQRWIWEAGGFGVFDPGINALSILGAITDEEVLVRSATFEVPSDCQTPIAAQLAGSIGGGRFGADFDFRERGTQTWSITIATDAGTADLLGGGAALRIDGEPVQLGKAAEYAGVYERFGELIASRGAAVDVRPLRIAADAFMIAERRVVEPRF